MTSLAVEREYVIWVRDRRCIVTLHDPAHVCRDRWGNRHGPTRLDLLTADHVHDHAGGTKGKRAPDDRKHMVAMCHGANVGVPSRALRQFEREYLARVEP